MKTVLKSIAITDNIDFTRRQFSRCSSSLVIPGLPLLGTGRQGRRVWKKNSPSLIPKASPFGDPI